MLFVFREVVATLSREVCKILICHTLVNEERKDLFFIFLKIDIRISFHRYLLRRDVEQTPFLVLFVKWSIFLFYSVAVGDGEAGGESAHHYIGAPAHAITAANSVARSRQAFTATSTKTHGYLRTYHGYTIFIHGYVYSYVLFPAT
jgi:hypothetical protein